jgi:Co/Zn/Cd efflux system component
MFACRRWRQAHGRVRNTAGSASLQADALDFLADASNYAISLFVTGQALRYRAIAALAKGATMRVRHVGDQVMAGLALRGVMLVVRQSITELRRPVTVPAE